MSDPTPPPLPPLPTWTDSASVSSYLASIIAIAVAVIALIHPGFAEPTLVQSLVPAVGAIIAGIAQIVNVVTKRSVQRDAVITTIVQHYVHAAQGNRKK